jgi:hypothetical protein
MTMTEITGRRLLLTNIEGGTHIGARSLIPLPNSGATWRSSQWTYPPRCEVTSKLGNGFRMQICAFWSSASRALTVEDGANLDNYGHGDHSVHYYSMAFISTTASFKESIMSAVSLPHTRTSFILSSLFSTVANNGFKYATFMA